VRVLIDFIEGTLANFITPHSHSVMSFIGYDYKKSKELVESPQDFDILDTSLD